MSQLTLSAPEIVELKAACAARMRELDKTFKACIKGSVQGAADTVTERIKAVRAVAAKLEDME